MHRFFMPPDCITRDRVHFPPTVTHQLKRVLRLRSTDRIVILDGSGAEYEVELTLVGGELAGRIVSSAMNRAEPQASIYLYQSVLKGDKFEWIVQKCTELGIAAVTPVLSARSVAGRPSGHKLLRYRDIAREAAEQCGRGRVPLVNEPKPFSEAVLDALNASTGAGEPAALMLWEEAGCEIGDTDMRSRVQALSRPYDGPISLFVGPEGGYTPDEAGLAGSLGLQLVSLGPRILRAETAAVAATTLVMGLLGEMG